jgi:NAD(P)-dependent dehydrogenase (short-subunit alcohol dehydrogenase family)
MVKDLGLEGARVIVTGAAGGLGREFALQFAQAGARVLVADINEAGAAETAEMLGEAGFSCGLDVADRASAQALAAKAQEAMGGVDVLVNNAALYATLKRAPFMELDEADFDRALMVNVKGVWQVTRAIAPLMQTLKSGSVINIASATVFSGSPEWMHYVASKGAVIAMTRVMAKELGGDNIRANVLAPGFTLTEASYGHIEDAKSYGVGRAALKRNAEVEDITGGVLYLASPLSSFMTGQTLVIDGGKQFI